MIVKNQAEYIFLLIEFPVTMSPWVKKYYWTYFAAGKTRTLRDFFFKQQSWDTKDSVAIAKQNPYFSKPSFKHVLLQHTWVPPNSNTLCWHWSRVVAGTVGEALSHSQNRHKFVCPYHLFSVIYFKQCFFLFGLYNKMWVVT